MELKIECSKVDVFIERAYCSHCGTEVRCTGSITKMYTEYSYLCPKCGDHFDCKVHYPCTVYKQKPDIKKALDLAFRYSQIDGDHHKAWVIDQMVRALTGGEYDEWIKKYKDDDEYEWDEGVAP
jgi:transposase-like protein